MAFTMGGFFESVDGAAAIHNIAAIPDQSLTFTGDNLRVPKLLPNLLGYAAQANVVTYTQARIDSPSLREMWPIDIARLDKGTGFTVYGQDSHFPLSPIPLLGDENIQWLNNTDAAAPVAEYGMLWFCDGPIQPISGRIYTIRATASITNVPGNWVNGAMTLSQSLPFGRYAVVGMRVEGATLIFARLVFVGSPWRPGVISLALADQKVNDVNRFGGLGVWGEFDSVAPPTLECIGSAGSSQVIFLDLIKIS